MNILLTIALLLLPTQMNCAKKTPNQAKAPLTEKYGKYAPFLHPQPKQILPKIETAMPTQAQPNVPGQPAAKAAHVFKNINLKLSPELTELMQFQTGTTKIPAIEEARTALLICARVLQLGISLYEIKELDHLKAYLETHYNTINPNQQVPLHHIGKDPHEITEFYIAKCYQKLCANKIYGLIGKTPHLYLKDSVLEKVKPDEQAKLQVVEIFNKLTTIWDYYAKLFFKGELDAKASLPDPHATLMVQEWKQITSEKAEEIYHLTNLYEQNKEHEQQEKMKAAQQENLQQVSISTKKIGSEITELSKIVSITHPAIELAKVLIETAIEHIKKSINGPQAQGTIQQIFLTNITNALQWIQQEPYADYNPQDSEYLMLKEDFNKIALYKQLQLLILQFEYVFNIYAIAQYHGNLQAQVTLQFNKQLSVTKTIAQWVQFIKNAGFRYSGEINDLNQVDPTTTWAYRLQKIQQQIQQKVKGWFTKKRLSKEETDKLLQQHRTEQVSVAQEANQELQQILNIMKADLERIKNQKKIAPKAPVVQATVATAAPKELDIENIKVLKELFG